MKLSLSLLTLFALGTVARATDAPGPFTSFRKSGCVVRARAYIDSDSKNEKPLSRFDLFVDAAPGQNARWEFTLPGQDNDSGDNISGEFSPQPYGNQKRTAIRATLHRVTFYDERVTFKNLELGSNTGKDALFAPMRHIELKTALTQTTPSGIRVTLPAQSADALPMSFNGNAEAVFIKIQVTPNTPLSRLPASPLFQKYGKAVRIKLEASEPNMSVSSQADNTYPLIGVGIPNLKTATKMDLTLIVRQKVELETIPVALDVPVMRPKK